jgi:hypothetical protein
MAPEPLAAEDERLLDEIARRVAERRLVTPALLALDVVRYTPGMHVGFFATAPLAAPLARFASMGLIRGEAEYERLVRIAERREHLDVLARKLEALS